MDTIDQLNEWVNGNPIHNEEKDVCCPDFSCCNAGMAEKSVRERFRKAYIDGDEETQHEILLMFLSKALNNDKIYIAGDKNRS